MAPNVPSIKFYNGYEYPLLGLGTWQSAPGQVTEAVKVGIDVGYRHFDCAHVYGNEKEIGEALKQKFAEGVVKREDLFITSKLWCTSHKKELVVPALKNTLANLGLEYLDLYLMHWPMGFKEGDNMFPLDENGKVLPSDSHFTETWAGLEECVQLGLTRSIGISNFNHKQIEEILKVAKINPVNNQVENHPYLTQQKLVDFCKERNISVTAYSPLGSPATITGKEPILLEDPLLGTLGKKYNKSPAQILIKYQIQRGLSVIPKSVTKSRIESNFDVFDFTLSSEDMSALNDLNKDLRLIKFDMTDTHKDYPFGDNY